MNSLVLSISALLGLTACAVLSNGLQGRQCPSFRTVAYFHPGNALLPSSADPIIRRLTNRISTCEAAGYRLEKIVVTGFPDRLRTDPEAEALARTRALAVREALEGAGLASEKIELADPSPEADDPKKIMRRRALVTVEMH